MYIISCKGSFIIYRHTPLEVNCCCWYILVSLFVIAFDDGHDINLMIQIRI